MNFAKKKKTVQSFLTILMLLLMSGCGSSYDRYHTVIAEDGTATLSAFWGERSAQTELSQDTPYLFCRTDILLQAGIDPDQLNGWTWDQFEEIGRRVYDVTGYHLCAVQGEDPSFFLLLLKQYFHANDMEYDRSGQDSAALLFGNGNAFQNAMELFLRLEANGTLEVTGPEFHASFGEALRTGRCAGVICSSLIVPEIEIESMDAGMWDVYPVPVMDQSTEDASVSWSVPATDSDQQLLLFRLMEKARLGEDISDDFEHAMEIYGLFAEEQEENEE